MTLYSNNYAKYIKLYGSIQNRDYSGAVIAEIMRTIYSKPWQEVLENKGDLINKIVNVLNKDGICKLPLNEKVSNDIIKRLEAQDINNDKEKRTCVVPSESYTYSLTKFLIDKDILSIVSRYLQAPARIQSWQVTWNNIGVDPKPVNGQLYHRDRDDFRSLRLYMYLNNVDDESGPHYYIKGSHLWKHLIEINEETNIRPCIDDSNHVFMSDEMVFEGKEYDKNKEIKIIGKPGYCWLEDGGGLHKGSVPKNTKASRFLLAVTWGLFDGQQFINGGGKEQITRLKKQLGDEGINLNYLQKYALGIN